MEIDQSSLKDAKTQALDQFGFGVLYVWCWINFFWLKTIYIWSTTYTFWFWDQPTTMEGKKREGRRDLDTFGTEEPTVPRACISSNYLEEERRRRGIMLEAPLNS